MELWYHGIINIIKLNHGIVHNTGSVVKILKIMYTYFVLVIEK